MTIAVGSRVASRYAPENVFTVDTIEEWTDHDHNDGRTRPVARIVGRSNWSGEKIDRWIPVAFLIEIAY